MSSIAWLAVLSTLAAGAHDLSIHNFSQATWIVRAADEATRTALTTLDQVSTLEVPGGETRRIALPWEGTFTFRLIDASARSGLEVAWSLLAGGHEGPGVRTEVRHAAEDPDPRDLVRVRADSLAILAAGYGDDRQGERLDFDPPPATPPLRPPAPEGPFARGPSPESATSQGGGVLRRPRARRARDLAHPYLTLNEWTVLREALGLEPSRDNVEKKEPNR